MSLPSLSDRQIAILDFIIKEKRMRGYPPSVREIGQAVGLSSSSTVHGHLAQLEEKGYIKRDPTKPRAIEILIKSRFENSNEIDEIVSVPILGKITAGQPILAVENMEGTFPIPVNYIGNKEVFLLTIKGDSMIEKGIFDGDFVLVSQQSTANNGDIVAALLEDEATVKTFYREADHIRLQPENNLLDPIIVKEVSIIGKIVGVFRWL